MIQPRGSAFISLTSIQPDSRVMTIGAASEDFRLALEKFWPAFRVEGVVEFVMSFILPFEVFDF
jgi:hypothetical protein